MAINCGAIPEGLIESELFGHEKGSFTGAVEDKPGLFEVAGSGTLFLDEVGELPLHVQVKLLRALQERRTRRVGGSADIAFSARVIAATNRALEAEVKAGRFREDLFYRLNVIQLRMPPLRERRGDIPAFLDFFLRRFTAELGRGEAAFSPEALELLIAWQWPGNIRELANVVERAATLSDESIIGPEALPAGAARRRAARRPGRDPHLRHRPAGPPRRAGAARARAGARAHRGQQDRGGEAARAHLPVAALPPGQVRDRRGAVAAAGRSRRPPRRSLAGAGRRCAGSCGGRRGTSSQ